MGYAAQHEHGSRHEVLYLIHYDTFLQNAIYIILKCDNFFITKCGKLITKCISFLLKNTAVITKCDDFITKCDNDYKTRLLLQIPPVQMAKNSAVNRNLANAINN